MPFFSCILPFFTLMTNYCVIGKHVGCSVVFIFACLLYVTILWKMWHCGVSYVKGASALQFRAHLKWNAGTSVCLWEWCLSHVTHRSYLFMLVMTLGCTLSFSCLISLPLIKIIYWFPLGKGENVVITVTVYDLFTSHTVFGKENYVMLHIQKVYTSYIWWKSGN